MPAYNTKFELTPEDLELIEDALRQKQRELSEAASTGCEVNRRAARGTHDLLGRLHNQKVFYRPKRAAYVGG
ncbi:MAG: hypothetical protein AAF700_01575 [Pseudomonadota bacterium]